MRAPSSCAARGSAQGTPGPAPAEVGPAPAADAGARRQAAGELRERLAKLVGQTQAARIHASTFHSLGLGIVRRFADLLGLPSDPMIMDSAQRNRLIRDIIRDERLYRKSLSTGISAAIDHARGTMESLRHLGMDAQAAQSWLDDARNDIGGFYCS